MKTLKLLPTSLALGALVFLSNCATDITLSGPTDEITVSRHIDNQNLTETIIGNHNGNTIQASVKFLPYDATTSSPAPHDFWLGTDDRQHIPKYVIDRLSLSENGVEVTIPQHLYSNFGDFKPPGYTLSLYEEKSGFILRVSGSDGAGSYSGHFYFDDQGLHKMFVQEKEIAHFKWKNGTDDDSTQTIQFPEYD